MGTAVTTVTHAAALALLLASTGGLGCQSGVKSTLPVIEVIAPIPQKERHCPVSGEAVTEEDAVAYFETYPVYCKGRENARQFASLEMRQRARLAAEQVLPQKGIANATCPLTGEKLTAAAAPVLFEGTVIGFASAADANQFRSLTPEKKARLIAQWKSEPANQ